MTSKSNVDLELAETKVQLALINSCLVQVYGVLGRIAPHADVPDPEGLRKELDELHDRVVKALESL